MTRFLIRTLLPAAWLLLAALPPSWSQGDAVAAGPSRTVIAELGEQIDRRAAEVENDPGFDEATRTAALQRLEQGRAFLAQALADLERTEKLAEERAEGPALEAAARAELNALREQAPAVETAGLSAAELERAAQDAAAAAENARQRVAELEQERTALRARRPVIGPELAEARAALQGVRQTQAEIRVASETRPGTATSLPRARAEEQALLARIGLLEEQRAGLGARESLQTARLELATEVASRASTRAELLRQARDERRRIDLETTAASASQDLFGQSPRLQEIAEANRALLERYPDDEAAARIAAERAALQAVERQLADLDAEISVTDRVLDSLGRSYAAGRVLVDVLQDLNDGDQHRIALRERVDRIEAAQVELVSLSSERLRIARELAALGYLTQTPSADAAADEANALLQQLLTTRLDLLEGALRSLEDYIGFLSEIQVRERELVTRLDQYQAALRARQAWVPNVAPLKVHELAGALGGFATVLDPALWRGLAGAFFRWLEAAPLTVLLLTAALLLASAASRRLARLARELAPRTAVGGVLARLGYGVLPSLAGAAALAVATWLAGVLIGAPPDAPPGFAALGRGLERVAAWVFVIAAVHALYAPRGPLLVSWPGWSHAAATVRRANGRIVWVVVLLLGAMLLFEAYVAGIGEGSDLAARLCLILAMAATVWAIDAVLRPGRGLLAGTVSGRPVATVRWHQWLYGLLLLVLVGLTVALLGGYVLATVQTARAVLATLALLAIFAAARAIATVQELPSAPEEELDAERQLVRGRNRLVAVVLGIALAYALWWTWRDVLTTLSYLQEVTLWTTESAQGVDAITVANVLWFLVLLAGTLIVFWALPVLAGTRSLDTSAAGIGGRYAVVTLVRYAVLVAGVMTAFSVLDIGWSKLQWMAAGLSVGLGFGLQETVANFIAGLMLLTEGQVRVGDVISVGDKTGVVSRIQMRATTVKDFDGREVIIPNKELVTTQVTNWTLSDANRRIQVGVGVAYGSDTDQVEKLLLDAADSVPWLLRDPAPRVVFEQFADNSLNFRLYVWIDSGQRVLDTIHELHRRIDQRFREHGIEIAFPQRDVHLDTGPLTVQLVTEPARTPAVASAT